MSEVGDTGVCRLAKDRKHPGVAGICICSHQRCRAACIAVDKSVVATGVYIAEGRQDRERGGVVAALDREHDIGVGAGAASTGPITGSDGERLGHGLPGFQALCVRVAVVQGIAEGTRGGRQSGCAIGPGLGVGRSRVGAGPTVVG